MHLKHIYGISVTEYLMFLYMSLYCVYNYNTTVKLTAISTRCLPWEA